MSRLADVAAAVDGALDREFLLETLIELARVPNAVEPGLDTLMEPDHPKLQRYVQRVVRPRLEALGAGELIDAPRNNLVLRAGAGTLDRSILIQGYAVSQHHNLMERPFEPVLRDGRVYAQGVSQTKAHQAVMLTVLKVLSDMGADLRGRLHWSLNCEGRSSHGCTEAILGVLDRPPQLAVLQTPERMRISLGNRGRLDIAVQVTGVLAHSSTPERGASAITGAAEAIRRVEAMRWEGEHPLLGRRQAVVYKVDFEPKLPHTLPATARFTVDRRMLPGDDPATAVDEVLAAIGDLGPYTVTARPDVMMLPSLVDPADPGVRALQAAIEAVRGAPATEIHRRGTFDAGGLARAGIPVVMFGCGGEGDWPAGDDFVAVGDVEDEARILATLILAMTR
jgi:acetylornithine deacetylase/succinyl-diaminopimelate desuccinylase-like protein